MSTALALLGAKIAVYPARMSRYKTQCSPTSPVCFLVAIYCPPPLRPLTAIISVGSRSQPETPIVVGPGECRIAEGPLGCGGFLRPGFRRREAYTKGTSP